MNIAPVRTIKVTDTLGHPAPDEIMSMESHKRRKNVLTALDAILVQRNRELQEELVKPNPDKEYIARRIAIINNIKNTLRAAQR